MQDRFASGITGKMGRWGSLVLANSSPRRRKTPIPKPLVGFHVRRLPTNRRTGKPLQPHPVCGRPDKLLPPLTPCEAKFVGMSPAQVHLHTKIFAAQAELTLVSLHVTSSSHQPTSLPQSPPATG